LNPTTPVTPVPAPNPALNAMPAPSALGPAKNPAKLPSGVPPEQGPAHVTLLKPEEKRPFSGLIPEVPFIWKVLPACELVALTLTAMVRLTKLAVSDALFNIPPVLLLTMEPTGV
jgi:hypothetical protein